jgi:hypothetical protein
MERGHQVLLMAAIYSRAEQVLCCLGDDEGGHAEYTFNLARKLSSKVGHLLDATFPKIHANISTGATAYIDLSWHFLANFDGLDHELGSLSGSEHFVELFRKPWFSRMWIRQEIGWAAKAMLRCGNSEIDWTSIVWLHFWATARSYWIGSTAKWTQAMPVVSDDFLDPSKSLLELLFASREFQCTDPRDKVFALLAHPSAYRDMALGSFEDYTAEVIQAKARGEDEHAVSKKLSEAFSNLTKYLISVLHEHFPQLKDIDSWETSEGQQDRARIEEVENVRINLLNIRDWMQGEIHKIESSSTRLVPTYQGSHSTSMLIN